MICPDCGCPLPSNGICYNCLKNENDANRSGRGSGIVPAHIKYNLQGIVDKLRLLPICQEHYSMNFGQFQSKIRRYDVDKDIDIGCPPFFLPNDTVGMSMKSQFTMNSCALGPKMELEIDS